MRQGCSQWAWAISSGISHHSNMHEWEITTVWGAITCPKSVRVRWYYLAGWEPLLKWGFLAPEEQGEVNYYVRTWSFGPCLWHGDISLDSRGPSDVLNLQGMKHLGIHFCSTTDFYYRDDLFLCRDFWKCKVQNWKQHLVVEMARKDHLFGKTLHCCNRCVLCHLCNLYNICGRK